MSGLTRAEFHELYAGYGPAARASCRAICGNEADADEALQAAFLSAWRARKRFDGRHPLAWLQTIGRNAALQVLRKRRPWVDDPFAWIKAPDPATRQPQHTLDAVRLLDSVRPEDAAYLRLRYAEGWRIGEIAEHFETSQRSVRRKLERLEHRARILVRAWEAA